MVFLEYDYTFEGLLTAIFEVYERKLTVVSIVRAGADTNQLFTENIIIGSNEAKAERVLVKAEKLVGKQGIALLWQAWLSELPEIDNAILGTIRYAIQVNKNVLSDFGHPDVLLMQQTAKMVSRERHRMKAFVRFQLTKDGLFYAAIEPDFNVLPLIINHFKDRYADQRWMIYDLKRSYGIYYDLQTVEFVNFEFIANINPAAPGNDVLGEKEDLYQALWQDYFKNTNIPSRRNIKLHLQHVPKRYWKYLTEKQL